MSNAPELRTYAFRKALNGASEGEVIALKDYRVVVDLGNEVVKIGMAEFWDHVRGDEDLVLGKEYDFQTKLDGAVCWTPIWVDEPSWEGPEVVIQDRNRNLRRLSLGLFWEYVRGEDMNLRHGNAYHALLGIFLFSNPLRGALCWRSRRGEADYHKNEDMLILTPPPGKTENRNFMIDVSVGRFAHAVRSNGRFPAPSPDILDAWLDVNPSLWNLGGEVEHDIEGAVLVTGRSNEGLTETFILARTHLEALKARINKRRKGETPPEKVVKTPVSLDYSSPTARYGGGGGGGGGAYDSNHYESPGQNPGSGGSGVGNDWDMCR